MSISSASDDLFRSVHSIGFNKSSFANGAGRTTRRSAGIPLPKHRDQSKRAHGTQDGMFVRLVERRAGLDDIVRKTHRAAWFAAELQRVVFAFDIPGRFTTSWVGMGGCCH